MYMAVVKIDFLISRKKSITKILFFFKICEYIFRRTICKCPFNDHTCSFNVCYLDLAIYQFGNKYMHPLLKPKVEKNLTKVI